ncbi:PAS domain-containing protein [Martelella radicis]|uniref:PAS domain-containing protein n=1 Tax=Martelella radicis TaxID=1397476 RepID=A0A7W6PAN4_9HYPH|nr:PAS domain-containing protein [Martelella radicis]MBB4121617.1 hypothetical protein [Martelella radicis]
MNSDLPQTADNRPVVQTLNRAPECILLVDPYGTIEIANDAVLSLLRADEADVCGTALISWFADADGKEIDRAMTRVLSDEPGSRLEEVSAEFAFGPSGRSHLSLARMRHRDAVCVVINRPASGRERPRRAAAMPRVSDGEFNTGSQKTAAAPVAAMKAAQTPGTDIGAVGSHMPWNTQRTRPAVEPARPQRTFANGFFHVAGTEESPAEENPVEQIREARSSAAAKAEREPDPVQKQQTRPSDSANTSAAEEVLQSAPVSAASPLRRDIYAEFESERDRREREQDIPLISPAKCLIAALERHRGEAVAESVMLATAIDDGGYGFPLDEDRLTELFSHLVERLIAVSPPYCDAQVALEPTASNGFRARFSDIGRGLSESELDAVFNQPELTIGISHTCLVEAQEAAARLGLKFSIRTAVESGTAVEITFID